MIRTSPPAGQYVDHPLSDSTVDWGYFHPVTTLNRSATIAAHYRVVLAEGEPREKKVEGEEKGELGDPTLLSLDDPDPSPPSLVGHCR